MAVNYNAAVKTARLNVVLAAIDVGTAGTLEICSAAYASILATIPLLKPSFSVSGSVMTLLGVPRSDVSADNTGTAALARIKDSAGTVIIDGLTVGVGSGEVQLGSLALSVGIAVNINSGTITHA